MSKNKIEKLQREFSKPQLSRWQKQKRRQRWIFIGGISVIVAVILIVGAGYYVNTWSPLHAVILNVNGTKFDLNDYINTLDALSKNDPSKVDTYSNYVLPYLEQSELLKQSAAKLGITVSSNEIKSLMDTQKDPPGYKPVIQGQLLSQKLIQNYFAPQVEKTADQRDVQAMLLESESQAAAIQSQLTDSNFGDLATSSSLDSYTQSNKGELGEHPQDIFPLLVNSNIPGDTAFKLDEGQISQPVFDPDVQKSVGYWLIMVIEKGTGDNEGKVNFRVMLLGSYQEAMAIKAQLDTISNPTQKADKFTELAREKSQYKNASVDGGLLGMTAKGTMSPAFDNVAFNLGVGEISNPVMDATQTTTGGYWLVKVTKIDNNKALSSSDTNMLAQNKYNEWFSNETNAYQDKIKETLSSNQEQWAVNKVKKELTAS